MSWLFLASLSVCVFSVFLFAYLGLYESLLGSLGISGHAWGLAWLLLTEIADHATITVHATITDPATITDHANLNCQHANAKNQ